MNGTTKRMKTFPGFGYCDEILDNIGPIAAATEKVVIAAPVDSSPVSDFYKFVPMPDASRLPSEIEERIVAPVRAWVMPQPPPPADYIKFTDREGLTRYMFGAHRSAPEVRQETLIVRTWKAIAGALRDLAVAAVVFALTFAAGIGIVTALWFLHGGRF